MVDAELQPPLADVAYTLFVEADRLGKGAAAIAALHQIVAAGDFANGMAGVRELLAWMRLDEYADAFEAAGLNNADDLITKPDTFIPVVHAHVQMKPGHVAKFEQMLRAKSLEWAERVALIVE